MNSNLVTCKICHNYFGDPRQIPCGHVFCFDCIIGRFDDENGVVVCPICKRIHQYSSRREFERHCMHDNFLATAVAQHKRTRSRLSIAPLKTESRPSPLLSITSNFRPASVLTAMFPRNTNDNSDRTHSPCSTSLNCGLSSSSSVVSESADHSLIARCQSCHEKRELHVCGHCENVICSECSNTHQNPINDDIKDRWHWLKNKFIAFGERSNNFDADHQQCITQTKNVQLLTTFNSNQLIDMIMNKKNDYINSTENYLLTHPHVSMPKQIANEYSSIDARIGDFMKSSDMKAETISDFLLEIEHLESQLNDLDEHLNSSKLKFPILTQAEHTDPSSLVGKLTYCPLNHHTVPALHDSPDLQRVPDYDDQEPIAASHAKKIKVSEILSSVNSTVVYKRRLLWRIDYRSVPYYIRSSNNRLFVCDKHGFLSVYEFNQQNNFRLRPTLIREINLFDKNSTLTTTDNEKTIDSFAVHKQLIIVLKRKPTELFGTIYLFTHDGQLIPEGIISSLNYSLRELTIDHSTNTLWTLDPQQHGIYYYKLPSDIQSSVNIASYFHDRYLYIGLPKSFSPKHLSMNENAIAILDIKRQAIHFYDRITRHELYTHVNNYNNTIHFCWDMALFSDNSLLVKLDDQHSVKSNLSKHIFLQLDKNNRQYATGMIDEFDAYGMLVLPTDEVLIGVRISKQGVVNCYI